MTKTDLFLLVLLFIAAAKLLSVFHRFIDGYGPYDHPHYPHPGGQQPGLGCFKVLILVGGVVLLLWLIDVPGLENFLQDFELPDVDMPESKKRPGAAPQTPGDWYPGKDDFKEDVVTTDKRKETPNIFEDLFRSSRKRRRSR